MNSKRLCFRPPGILSLTFHSSLIILLWCIQCPGQNQERLYVLKVCKNLFGESIDANANLFDISSEFVLQIHFDAGNNLASLEVVPKYFLHDMHPEWNEPDEWPLLTKSQFQSLLSQLDNITSRGKIVASGHFCVVSNNTCPLIDKYVHAWGQTGGNKIRFFEFYPFHEIEGKIIKTEKITFKELLREPEKAIYRVLIGELIYDVERDEYARLHEGQAQRFLAVGPIKGHCLAGFYNK
jgi:hypothetical protein